MSWPSSGSLIVLSASRIAASVTGEAELMNLLIGNGGVQASIGRGSWPSQGKRPVDASQALDELEKQQPNCYKGRVLGPDDFRRVLGHFASGVTVVTTLDADGRPAGLT